MEMNALIPPTVPNGSHAGSNGHRGLRSRELPVTSLRFKEELGDGAFGKIYKGELGGQLPGSGTLVGIKTLRPGATAQTRQDFHREVEMCTELRHPNIACLLGVVLKDEPQSMVFEYLSRGDLHEFLIAHSPKHQRGVGGDSVGDLSDDDMSSIPAVTSGLDPSDMSFIAIQIAAGMEYLAGMVTNTMFPMAFVTTKVNAISYKNISTSSIRSYRRKS